MMTGSLTAGGITLTTFGLMVGAVISTLRAQTDARFSAGRRIRTPPKFRAITIVALSGVTHVVVPVLLALTEDVIGDSSFGVHELMFESMSALATAGVTTGVTGAMELGLNHEATTQGRGPRSSFARCPRSRLPFVSAGECHTSPSERRRCRRPRSCGVHPASARAVDRVQ